MTKPHFSPLRGEDQGRGSAGPLSLGAPRKAPGLGNPVCHLVPGKGSRLTHARDDSGSRRGAAVCRGRSPRTVSHGLQTPERGDHGHPTPDPPGEKTALRAQNWPKGRWQSGEPNSGLPPRKRMRLAPHPPLITLPIFWDSPHPRSILPLPLPSKAASATTSLAAHAAVTSRGRQMRMPAQHALPFL